MYTTDTGFPGTRITKEKWLIWASAVNLPDALSEIEEQAKRKGVHEIVGLRITSVQLENQYGTYPRFYVYGTALKYFK
ncbi:hypothetical protein OIA45_40625 (plasmid) [Streptomyces chartreusis]|uniref:hypothetical protein n=1 Tax=Streptomyces chartreusis TaxID=1969 RepID=UPI002F90C00B|nr:hypothetical protein OIA45_40625 [Streptomyces chartreusis]